MVDMTMCQNHKCVKCLQCFRYTAPPSDRQSYACFSPGKTKTCKYFVKDDRPMKSDEQILEEARAWVKGINKHFKIKRPIVVKACNDKDSDKYYMWTLRSTDEKEPFSIHIYTKYFKRKDSDGLLFRKVAHEMIHLLLYPMVGAAPDNTRLGQIEETIVVRLESLIGKISERK